MNRARSTRTYRSRTVISGALSSPTLRLYHRYWIPSAAVDSGREGSFCSALSLASITATTSFGFASCQSQRVGSEAPSRTHTSTTSGRTASRHASRRTGTVHDYVPATTADRLTASRPILRRAPAAAQSRRTACPSTTARPFPAPVEDRMCSVAGDCVHARTRRCPVPRE